MITDVGVVVIGRNEGERLKNCLNILLSQAQRIVYVDSGSTDESVDFAKSLGIEVVELDASTSFSAGRARNEGFDRVLQLWSDAEFVQFVDGDCEIEKGWLAYAVTNLAANNTWAIVSGRVKERFPEQSIYNFLCDIEWNTPVEESKSCGGIFMIKVKAFQEMNGFNTKVIAGEEPELCYRLRQQKWKIFRLDHPMAIHDANMTRFGQWWRRCVRSGHGYAQGYALHGRESEKYCLRDSLRIWLWAFVVPIIITLLSFVCSLWWLILLVIYPVQLVRTAINQYKLLSNWKQSFIYSFFILIGKWPQMIGQLLFLKRKLSGDKYLIIEYN